MNKALATFNHAINPSVDFEDDFIGTSVSSTDNTLPWYATVNSGTAVVADSATGGQLLITTHTDANDVVNLQVPGEAFTLAASKPLTYNARVKITDVSTTAAFFGLNITDTAILNASGTGQGATSDGIGFVWDGTYLWAVATKNGTTTWVSRVNTGKTLADATFALLTFYFDGNGKITWYVDNEEVASITDQAATVTLFPDDEDLTPSIEVQVITSGAQTAYVDFVSVSQDR